MRPILITALAAAAIVLAGCGQKGPLVPAPGAPAPDAAVPPPAPLPPGAQRPSEQTPPGTDAIRR
jgi:predicted small lipoprotein YifL